MLLVRARSHQTNSNGVAAREFYRFLLPTDFKRSGDLFDLPSLQGSEGDATDRPEKPLQANKLSHSEGS